LASSKDRYGENDLFVRDSRGSVHGC